LNDLAISKDPAATREMHLILKQEGLKINGNAGCNSFFGSFELKADNGISFGKMGSTMMACKDMQLESQFLEALTKANTYSIIGNQLTISKDNAVLAKFEGRGLR
jgi:heat shock protein HslJ